MTTHARTLSTATNGEILDELRRRRGQWIDDVTEQRLRRGEKLTADQLTSLRQTVDRIRLEGCS